MPETKAPAKSTAGPMSLDDVLCDELQHVRPGDETIPKDGSLKKLQAAIDGLPKPLAALCLSGGGIRSAAFALGAVQALARFGLLEEFDYLSTVSGGGYIGSFLTAWRKHAGSDARVLAGLDRTRNSDGEEAPEISGIRDDSNYLTPKLGALSADTWTVIALVVRNLVLNWLVFLPFFMGLLFLPWICYDLVGTPPQWLRTLGIWLPVIGAACVTVGLACASYGRRHGVAPWLTNERFVFLVLGPVAAGSMALTGAAAVLGDAGPTKLQGALAGALCYVVAWLLAGMFRPETMASRVSGDKPDLSARFFDLLAWSVAGAIAGFLIALGMRYGASFNDTFRPERLVVLGITWTMSAIFAGELLYVGLRSYARRGDMDREWLGRAAGWLAAGAVTWSVFSAVALFGPHLLDAGLRWVVGFVAAGGISGAVALVLGSGARTAATFAVKASGRLSLTQIAGVAGMIFAVLLATALSAADAATSNLVTATFPALVHWPYLVDVSGLLLLAAMSFAVSGFVNINRFSLHALYRNRLVRAFLGSARARARVSRAPDPFTGFDHEDNPRMADVPTRPPLHVVNITLNVTSSKKLAWQERKAESFTITPLASGNPQVGYRRTQDYGCPDGGITLGTAMAISGAAVSPNMGYHSSPILGFLLTLFNARLGWWLGNPGKASYRRDGPKFGVVPLLQELAGQTTDDGNWVYLSDGGHFENLGLYEMVRRRCRYIVISDAGCDPDCTTADLGNAVRKIYIDLGVAIDFKRFDIAARKEPPARGVYGAIGEITYPGSDKPGWLLYIKPGYHGSEPAHVRSYALTNRLFPHESTAQQWFSESQFEAYRGLGAHIVERLCNSGKRLDPRQRPPKLNLETFRVAAEKAVSMPPDPAERAMSAPAYYRRNGPSRREGTIPHRSGRAMGAQR